MKVKTLSNGQKVRIKPVAPMLVSAIQKPLDAKRPRRPLVETGAGKIETETPEYLDELRQWTERRTQYALGAMVLFGFELLDDDENPVSSPPEDWATNLEIVGVDWRKEAESYGFAKVDKKYARKIETAMYLLLACMDGNDLRLVQEVAGVTDEDIAAAAESFPGNAA